MNQLKCQLVFAIMSAAIPIAQRNLMAQAFPSQQQSGESPASSEQVKSEVDVASPATEYYGFRKHGGIVYRRGNDFRLTCDVYVPEGDGPFPAVLAIHGGAWRSGSKLQFIRHAWRMARNDFVVVAINYRHAPKHKFPAQLHDCKHAVRWMRANAALYKINPSRIAAFGYSAGGHLASMLGTTDASDGFEGETPSKYENVASRVQAVVAGGAPCEFSWIGERSPALVFWLGTTKQANQELYLRASPTHYVTPDDPPFYFFHGEIDVVVPPATSKVLYEKLQANGVECEYDEVLGKGHVGCFTDLIWADRAIEFLNRVFGRQGRQGRRPNGATAPRQEPAPVGR